MINSDILKEEFRQLLHEQALAALRRFGIAVENDKAVSLLKKRGVKFRGNRAYFEPEFADEQLTSIYQSVLKRDGGKKPFDPDAPIALYTGDMPQHYRNPVTGEIGLMSVENMIEATKFSEAIRDQNTFSGVPGVPRGIPPVMQALTEYAVGCRYCSAGGAADTMYPPAALPFLFSMAEAMETPIRGAGMFTVSPMRMGGFEFDTAVDHLDVFEEYSLTSTPSVGVGAPVYQDVAWVMTLAEVIGGAVILHLISGGKPVRMLAGLFPFDFRCMMVEGGPPEYVRIEYERYLLSRRYNPNLAFHHTMTTMDKTPGLQAGLEKAYGAGYMTAMGCRMLAGAGMLSFDDIYSPEQHIADIQLRDYLQQLVGRRQAPPVEEWQEIIAQGVEGGYMDTESTLEGYRKEIYTPFALCRQTLYDYQNGRPQRAEAILREQAIAKLKSCCYRPDEGKISKIRAIYEDACRKLAPETLSAAKVIFKDE